MDSRYRPKPGDKISTTVKDDSMHTCAHVLTRVLAQMTHRLSLHLHTHKQTHVRHSPAPTLSSVFLSPSFLLLDRFPLVVCSIHIGLLNSLRLTLETTVCCCQLPAVSYNPKPNNSVHM
ncbi:hypothetical protein ACTXT7_003948 [Hymenolepis weldensis]